MGSIDGTREGRLSDVVSTVQHDGVLTITLDRRPVNALRIVDLKAISRAVRDADARAHAIVFRSEGGGFGGGNEVSEFADEPASYRRNVHFVQDALEAVNTSPALTISLVHGYCVGSSALLAAACDLCIASDSSFFSFPELYAGAPGGLQLLRSRMSRSSAMDVLLSGRRVGAHEAQVLGLVDRVVSDHDLRESPREYHRLFGPDGTWDGGWLIELLEGWKQWSRMDLWTGYSAELDYGGRMRQSRRRPDGH